MSRKRKNMQDELLPTVNLTSDGDLLVKSLLEKQLSTQCDLLKELQQEKIFISSTEYKLCNYVSGINSLNELKNTSHNVQVLEDFRNAGLSEEDCHFYLNEKKGIEYLRMIHKNLDHKSIEKRLFEIKEILKNYKNSKNFQDSSVNAIGRLQTECMLSMKPNSIETNLLKFALNNGKKINKVQDEIEPMKVVEKDFLNSLGIKLDGNNIAKLQRKVQRRLRAVSKRVYGLVSISEKSTIESSEIPPIKHSKWNSRIVGRIDSSEISDEIPSVNRSKWDLKYEDIQSSVNRELNMSKSKEQDMPNTYANSSGIINSKSFTPKTRISGNRYTIKNGTIIKLGNPIDYTQKEKLTVEQIRNIPKFSQYTTGYPSKILYLMNTHSLSVNDLEQLFKSFNFQTKAINLMKGRMKGQAFVEMENWEIAKEALKHINGIIVKNKPVIIQFSTKNELT